MKVVSTLLLLLLLFLTGQPPCMATEPLEISCCSDSDCPTEEKDSSHSQKENCGGCNPFQACSCCAAAILLPTGFTMFSSPVIPTELPVWSLTGIGRPQSRAADFWQPPRFA